MNIKRDEKEVNNHNEIKGLFLLFLNLILFLSFYSFIDGDDSANWLGLVGYTISWLFIYGFGIGAYIINIYIAWLGLRLMRNKPVERLGFKNFYFFIFLCSFSMLANLAGETNPAIAEFFRKHVYSERIVYPYKYIRYNLGGVPLYYLYIDLPNLNLQRLISNIGIGIISSTSFLLSFLLVTKLSIVPPLSFMKRMIISLFRKIFSLPGQAIQRVSNIRVSNIKIPAIYKKIEKPQSINIPLQNINPIIKQQSLSRPIMPQTIENNIKQKLTGIKAKDYNAPVMSSFENYRLPPLSLLTTPKKVDLSALKKDLQRQAEILEETLLSFGIEATVSDIHCGPTITSFEVLPAVGVKVQKIKTLENDIALNLQAHSIRIIAPIPGKAAVGIEIPSPMPQEVNFKEMLQDYQKSTKKLKIPTIIGKAVNGESVISDLTRMPHLIIAGATGSGKSVCINSIIMAILMCAKPDEIKLLMVDPKKIELTPYTRLPHMIAPVITDPQEAYDALKWLVKEMEYRYEVLKQIGVRNISSFNSRPSNPEDEEAMTIKIPAKMQYIVCIIDELADLMMVSNNDIETPIARLAQMARAIGIHVILATQRPSREVITGIIKANFPTRISFKVSSRINSQIVLDENGAESLLGNGDLLFLPPGMASLTRAQGPFVRDEDINKTINFICRQASPNYEIKSFSEHAAQQAEIMGISTNRDSFYNDALKIVQQTGNASTTFLQRKLKIGYARAAGLMDDLEENGVVGPAEGSKARRVLVLADK